MHPNNQRWWAYCKKIYPEYFQSKKVIELGSFNVNGTIRAFFEKDCIYTGVDWRAGPCVDIVSLVHELKTDEKFDTVVSASMLEHDKHHDKTIEKMIALLDDKGIMILSFGTKSNVRPHCPDEAVDGGYHPVGREIYRILLEGGLYIHEFRYMHKFLGCEAANLPEGGEMMIIAFRDQTLARGKQIIDEFEAGD